jgi:hypothetical protein
VTDERHDDPTVPDDVVEDLSPEAEADDVSGGAGTFLKIDGIKGESQDDSLKGEIG